MVERRNSQLDESVAHIVGLINANEEVLFGGKMGNFVQLADGTADAFIVMHPTDFSRMQIVKPDVFYDAMTHKYGDRRGHRDSRSVGEFIDGLRDREVLPQDAQEWRFLTKEDRPLGLHYTSRFGTANWDMTTLPQLNLLKLLEEIERQK